MFSDQSLIEASYFKALLTLVNEAASSAPWRGRLKQLALPTRVLGETDSFVGQDEELMTSTCELLSHLPSLHTLHLGPPCMSTILGLLQAKEAGALPSLASLKLRPVDKPQVGSSAFFLLCEWMNGRYEQGEKVFVIKYKGMKDPKASSRLIEKLRYKNFPWLELDSPFFGSFK
jgi:hypothetical protein